MKIVFILCFVFVFLQQEALAQACASNIPSSIIKGSDSTETNGEQTFRSLVVNPKNPNVVYIGTEGNGVFKSIDGGTTWHWLRKGMKHLMDQYPETYCLAINPEDTSEIAMAMNAGPAGQTNTAAGVYLSANGGAIFNQYNCGIANSGTALVWYNELQPDTIFAASNGGESSQTGVFYPTGIYRSINKGLNWSTVNFPSAIDSSAFFRISTHGNNGLLYCYDKIKSKSKGFIYTIDGAANWNFLSNPLSGKIIAEFDASPTLNRIYAVPRDSNILYYSTDTGKHWTRNNFEINGLMCIYPGAADTILFDHGGTLVRSSNGMLGAFPGNGYSDVISTGSVIEKLVYAPSNPRIIYMSTRGYKVYKSIDGGHHFTLLTHLRDSIEKFQDVNPDVKLIHGAACVSEQVQLTVLNKRSDYSIINCEWMGDSNLLHSPGIQINWVFKSHNKFGTFPITANVIYDNGQSAIFYDTVYINEAKPIASFAITPSNNILTFNAIPVVGASYYWDFGDGTTDSTQHPIHTYAANGNYLIRLTVTDKKTLCSNNDFQTYTILISGLDEKINRSQLKVFPNPATNILNIESTKKYKTFYIYNLLGEKMKEGNYQEQIDISNLNSGIYLLQLENGNQKNRMVFSISR